MTSNSRTQILNDLRAALPESSPLPELASSGPWNTFEDIFSRFSDTISAVGGNCIRVSTRDDANAALQELSAWHNAKVRCSLSAGIGDSTFDPYSVSDPHSLNNTDFAVLPGKFGVAENGAIWVTDSGIPHRVLFFLPQHLALVIPAGQIVHNMHEAYARIQPRQNAFAGFISGPSKTADIEQSLVIGAHGARSLTVLAVDDI
jgi:L-lactate dehydrogenase complex protein LldG